MRLGAGYTNTRFVDGVGYANVWNNFNGQGTSELLNADGLDDSISQGESNADGDDESSELLGGILQKRKLKKSLQEITGCKRPLVMIGKKKKAYNDCIAEYKASVESSKDAAAQAELKAAQAAEELAATKQQLEDVKNAQSSMAKIANTANESTPEPEKKKFLGMPMGVGIAVTVIAAAGIGFAIWKFKKK